MTELRKQCLQLLAISDPQEKCVAVMALHAHFERQDVSLDTALIFDMRCDQLPKLPGRPNSPILVDPTSVQRRSMNTIEGRAVLIHALAHIEFNAINLALDAVWRFPNMPQDYYSDWLSIAKEESYHFQLLAEHLGHLGYRYGDFPAHNGLWEMVEKTVDSPLARMALVPRTLEARGLDALPPILERMQQVKDQRAVEILQLIYRDEVGHVAIGNRWFQYLCDQEQRDPIATYLELTQQYGAPKVKGPLNLDARKAAGFSDRELLMLEGLSH